MDRRGILRTGLRAGIVLAVIPAEQAWAACVDPATLSSAQRNARAAQNYRDAAIDPKESCAACVFFTASQSGQSGCGRCQMFQGPVAATGHCDSWTGR